MKLFRFLVLAFTVFSWSARSMAADSWEPATAGRYSEALELYRRELETRRALYGSETMEVADALNNLGHAYGNLKSYASAKEYHERALAVRVKLFGEDHPDTASSLLGLEVDYDGLKDDAKAKEPRAGIGDPFEAVWRGPRRCRARSQ
ncbi:MAG: tetratricopeptide repeat protein [Synergistaceae bacterium]|nr:tetratricopeptide repeat protein [Synergistaceae bacterium]